MEFKAAESDDSDHPPTVNNCSINITDNDTDGISSISNDDNNSDVTNDFESSHEEDKDASMAIVQPPVRRRRVKVDKICRVCGDKALANNFHVMTCESCKAFFRRNVFKWEQLKECAFQRSCPINVRTRRFCSACRLKKCFDIGMRANMIQDTKSQPRIERISKKYHKRRSPITRDNSGLKQNGRDVMFDQYIKAPGETTDKNKEVNFHGHARQHNNMGSISKNSQQELVELPHQVAFEVVPSHLLPSDPHMYWRLTEEEREQLTHLTANHQNTILRLPQKGGASERPEVALQNITLEDLLGRCDYCANNVVKLMKGITDYRQLQVEDQLAALKACAMRTLILKGAACFVVERDAWVKAYGELPVSLFVKVTGHEKLIRQHADFCKSLKLLFKNDITMYALLQCVMLFDPSEPAIVDRQLVNTFRDKYLLLLKHYLQSQLSYQHAERYMDHLRDKLSELRCLAEKMRLMFKEWTGLIQPLMIEVLGLGSQ